MNLKPKETPAAPRTAMGSRLLSALLTLVMVLGLLPVSVFADLADSLSGLAVQSAGTVTYHRKTPEVAILNRYNGNDQSFYKKLIGNTDGNESDRAKYWQYNAVTLFTNSSTWKTAQYRDRATDDTTWHYAAGSYTNGEEAYSHSVLKQLTKPSKNLEVGASATFYNRTHTHSNYEWKKVRTWTVDLTRFESLSVGIGGSYAPAIGGNLDKSRKYPRVGNFGDIGSGYKTLSYNENNNYCRLHFYPSTHKWFDFEDRECTCSVYAENVLVTFRDTRSPQISNIEYSLNDGKTWTSRYTRAAVGAGRTVKIKLTFDEPIRFADDTNAHGDLFLDLRADGVNKGAYKAYLTELNGNDLIFEYTVPDSQSENALTGDVKIAAIDMDDLFAETKLVQVGKDGAFEIADKTGEGFTTSRCAITDLAGNPMREDEKTIVDANLTLDAGAPYVDTVEFNLNTNNADVKEALGKTDRDDVDYTDASDTHLGVGDSFYLIVHMNERLKGIGMDKENGRYKIDWQHAVFTTNLKDKNGAAVEVRSAYFYSFYDYDYDPTQFITDRVTIGEKWTVDDPKGEIKVTGMRFAGKEGAPGTLAAEVTDLAGNPLDMDSVKFKDGANGNPPKLDVDAPEVTELQNSYAKDGTGFRYGVKIADTQTEIAGLNGSFILNNGGDGKAYPYQWAVKADPAQVADDEWQNGVTGVAQQFMQTPDVYFYIRPVSGETYVDFSSCTITVKAKDYAGNESDTELPAGGLDWYIDNLAPTVTAGAVTRALNSGNTSGTLTVEVELTDGRGISAWQYTWTDSADTEPSEDGWQSGALDDTTSGTVTVKVSENVSAGSIFSKYLWVKAADNVAGETKNVSDAICLGQYSYNLTPVEYDLDYTSDIQQRVSLTVKLADNNNDTLFVAWPIDAANGRYALTPANSSVAVDVLRFNSWFSCTRSENNGVYTFVADNADITDLVSSINNGSYTGTLPVTIYAGKATAANYDSDAGTWTFGDGQYPFTADTITLRAAGNDPESNYKGGISLSADNLSPNANGLLSTLEGLRFTVTIGEDKLGWKHENIDWQNSYIRLFNQSVRDEDIDRDTKYYLNPVGNTNDAVKQTILIGDKPSATGRYLVELHVAFRSGGSTDVQLPDKIYVDATQPDDDFQFQPISYDILAEYHGRNPYGLKDHYGIEGVKEIDKNSEDVYVLPLYGYGEYDFTDSSNAVSYYGLSVKCETDATPGYFLSGDSKRVGEFEIVMWNTADPTVKLKLQGDTAQQEFANEAHQTGFVFSQSKVEGGRRIYLEPNKENIVAIQKVYANGAVSSVKYVRIRPVSDGVDGTAVADAKAGKLVFTPESGKSTAGLKVFAWAYQNENGSESPYVTGADLDNSYWMGKGQRIDLTSQTNGAWTADLLPDGAIYRIFTESANGTLCESVRVAQRAPWFNDSTNRSDAIDAQHSGVTVEDKGNGTYVMTFSVRDDYDTMEQGLDINIGLTFQKKDGEGKVTQEYAADRSFKCTGDYSWAASGAEATGIYSIEVQKTSIETSGPVWNRDILNVTVTGAYPKGYDTLDVTVTATDAFGNTGSVSSGEKPVNYQQPEVKGHTMTTVTFNQPVRPVESWAWHEKDGNGFETEWIQAFPIPGNGTWSIQFRDAFGQTHVATVNTNKFTDTESGIDYSIDLGFSTTDVTKDPVILTTNAANGTVKVYEINGTIHTEMIPVDGFPGIGTQKRQTVISENMETKVELTGINGKNIIRLRVYIDNIITGAPKADVHYYVEQLGQEFTAEELTAYVGSGLAVTGNVRAWYTTDRHVTPTGGTGTEFTFTPGGPASYTFTYVDDLGSTGTATAQLPTGLTLQGYVEPPADTTAPDVDIDLYVKRGGVYTRAETIPGTTASSDITAKFDALGYVQGYSLTINASDASGFTIAATGGSLTGNVLTITETGLVTITVTDKSSDQNTTTITFTVPDRIDTTWPKGTIAVKAKSLYEKVLTITLEDTDNKGDAVSIRDESGKELDTVTLDVPVGARRIDRNTYEYDVTDNGKIQFLFRDIAGNTGTASERIVGIDTEPPKLTVRWSPSAKTYYDEATKTWIDVNSPPSDPVNTNVIAHIESNKAMHGLTVRAGNEKPEQAHTLLEEGIAKSYEILGPDNNKPLVTFEVTPEKVTVTYTGNYDQTLIFTATAPNGKSSEVVLNGVTVIDKDAPEITVLQIDRYDRKGNKVTDPNASAYEAFVVLVPQNESAFAVNYGTPGQKYSASLPLFLTFTADGTYNVVFADEAGNTTVVPITVTGIDRTAPELTVTTVEENNQVKATVKVNEACTVTWGENGSYRFDAAGSHEITFTQNGTFAITAVDAAGNESFQMVSVGSIDNDPPSISFDNSTIYVMEGSAKTDLDDALKSGYKVWDNVTAEEQLTVVHDGDTDAMLKKAGQYVVTYTVTDNAKNVTTAARFVRVIGKDTVCVSIDGKLILPNSTAVLAPGDHKLTLTNNDQPYSVKARRGILSAGQMKYLSGSSLSFDANGRFTVNGTGYYTLLVTTQDRQTIRILLYIEQ